MVGQAFGAVHWEVRNAAALAFGALLSRMVGYMNVRAALSNRRTTTGSDFFHRYPPLHAFLLEQLSSAVSSMEARGPGAGGGAGRGSEGAEGAGAAELHPSLHPVLMLLSRLRPSVQCRNVDDPLSPAAFVAPVSVCARQTHHAVRVLASRALSPLVAPEVTPQPPLEARPRRWLDTHACSHGFVTKLFCTRWSCIVSWKHKPQEAHQQQELRIQASSTVLD